MCIRDRTLKILPVETLCSPIILISLTKNSSKALRFRLSKNDKKIIFKFFINKAYRNLDISLKIAKTISMTTIAAPPV